MPFLISQLLQAALMPCVAYAPLSHPRTQLPGTLGCADPT